MGFYSDYDSNASHQRSRLGDEFVTYVNFFFEKVLPPWPDGSKPKLPVFVSQVGEGCCAWWATHIQYEEADIPYRRITFIARDCDKGHHNGLIRVAGIERLSDHMWIPSDNKPHRRGHPLKSEYLIRVSEKPRIVREDSGNITVYFDEFLKPEEQGWNWEDRLEYFRGNLAKGEVDSFSG